MDIRTASYSELVEKLGILVDTEGDDPDSHEQAELVSEIGLRDAERRLKLKSKPQPARLGAIKAPVFQVRF